MVSTMVSQCEMDFVHPPCTLPPTNMRKVVFQGSVHFLVSCREGRYGKDLQARGSSDAGLPAKVAESPHRAGEAEGATVDGLLGPEIWVWFLSPPLLKTKTNIEAINSIKYLGTT